MYFTLQESFTDGFREKSQVVDMGMVSISADTSECDRNQLACTVEECEHRRAHGEGADERAGLASHMRRRWPRPHRIHARRRNK